MKRCLSVFLSFFFGLALCLTAVSKPSKAFTVKKKITLIVGESFDISEQPVGNTFKSIASSNKRVAVVKKTDDLVTITAKKNGESVVTLKTKDKTTYKFTVIVK